VAIETPECAATSLMVECMGSSKNSLKTFTAAIIKALCDVRVKARDSSRVNRTALSMR